MQFEWSTPCAGTYIYYLPEDAASNAVILYVLPRREQRGGKKKGTLSVGRSEVVN
jgi:hypothetical protein